MMKKYPSFYSFSCILKICSREKGIILCEVHLHNARFHPTKVLGVEYFRELKYFSFQVILLFTFRGVGDNSVTDQM